MESKNVIEEAFKTLKLTKTIKQPCSQCIKNLIQCETCKGIFKLDFYISCHEELCTKLHEDFEDKLNYKVCAYCSKNILKKYYDEHILDCSVDQDKSIVLIKCSWCDLEFTSEDLEDHEAECKELFNLKQLASQISTCNYCFEKFSGNLLSKHQINCKKVNEKKKLYYDKLDQIKNHFIVIYPEDWEYKSAHLFNDFVWLVSLNSQNSSEKENLKYSRVLSILDKNLENAKYSILHVTSIENKMLYNTYFGELERVYEKDSIWQIRNVFLDELASIKYNDLKKTSDPIEINGFTCNDKDFKIHFKKNIKKNFRRNFNSLQKETK